MGRTKKPRKAYRLGRVDPDPVDLAISRASKLRLVQRLDLMRPLRKAFDGLRMGTGGWAAWASVADGLNVAEELSLLGIASDRTGEIVAAQLALKSLHERVQQRGTWTMRAEEITAIEWAIDLHDIQLQHASQGEVERAIETVKRTRLQVLKGNGPRNATVCVGALGAVTQPGATA